MATRSFIRRPQMMTTGPAFTRQVDAAALLVLKQKQGLRH
jgi:hypothetical protein